MQPLRNQYKTNHLEFQKLKFQKQFGKCFNRLPSTNLMNTVITVGLTCGWVLTTLGLSYAVSSLPLEKDKVGVRNDENLRALFIRNRD